MHACIVCGKTIPEETIIRICGKAETKIDGKVQTTGNIICDECLDNGWMYCMDEHSEIHIVQIAPSTEPDKIFTVRELMLEGRQKMQSINCCDNIEGVSIIHLCEVCQRAFALTFEEELNLPKERFVMESTIAGIRQKYICNLCSIDNWRFTGDGVLINETPSYRR